MFRGSIGGVAVTPGDKFVAGLIATIYLGSMTVSFQMDFTPMQVWNRIISGQGRKQKSCKNFEKKIQKYLNCQITRPMSAPHWSRC